MAHKHLPTLFLAAFLVLASACANPLNKATFQRYYQAGLIAETREDYAAAKEDYYRALVNARAGNLGPQLHACSSYSLGRMLGALCDHDNAEKLLLEALQFDRKSSGPAYMDLFELAYLKYDQGNFAQAAAYFEQALPLVQDQKYTQADPGTFVRHYQHYSEALSRTGKIEAAVLYSDRAKKLSELYPDKKPKADRIDYNQNCIAHE